MDTSRIRVSYNEDLHPLETVLAKVSRPGDFYAHGVLETPLPRVEVEGVGVVSFPVPAAQIQQLVEQAERAPYGRGGETLLDTSVRKVWQIRPSAVQLGGRSWEATFQVILSRVTAALGCGESQVTAELYKLLIYDQGGFFKAHRDTEKVEGMFGTLVVVLPSFHRGGELVVRHAGREVVLDLSNSEVSELKFAAFYADCEHEVRPVTEGNRVCLIYNLLQKQAKGAGKLLTAPLYETEVLKAAQILQAAFNRANAPAKLAWLLGHQYSPAGLSFSGLKGEDAALAKVLRQAGERAGCAAHLGIVHIEESGPAQPAYDSYRSSRRRRYRDDDEDADVSSDEFEIIEVSDVSRYLDQWRDCGDRVIDFGKLPLADGEILPDGALDDEDPDEQRLMEATGNEGATFERSYHRAALVLWPRDRFATVLLQAGVGAALPYLRQQMDALHKAPAGTDRATVLTLAAQIIAKWEASPPYPGYSDTGRPATCAEMLPLLHALADPALLARFVRDVLPARYDGSENELLAAALPLLGGQLAGELLSQLVRKNVRSQAPACIRLLSRCLQVIQASVRPERQPALQEVAEAVVEALPDLPPHDRHMPGEPWWRDPHRKPVDGEVAADLLASLAALPSGALLEKAAAAMISNRAVFDPARVMVPALKGWHRRGGAAPAAGPAFWELWQYAADALLARSEFPPEAPRDWRQNVQLSCKCADCAELQKFALDPVQKVYRFRARQDKRQHVESQISGCMDVECVTDRSGSPQTLVCTKTRATYQRQCDQHKSDMGSLQILAKLAQGHSDAARTCERIAAACGRKPVIL